MAPKINTEIAKAAKKEADRVRRAAKLLRDKKTVLIYDADEREGEVDLVIASEFITPGSIREMRVFGGGLICTTLHADIWKKFGLPYLADVYAIAGAEHSVMRELIPNDIPYDAKSAFGVTINHRKTFTGINDFDRSLTISELAKTAVEARDMQDEEARVAFGARFRAPGHIHLLNAADGLLSKRRGHTELATAMTVFAKLTPSATICEMIGPSGKALPKKDAERYAKNNGTILIRGEEIIEYWNKHAEERDYD